MLTKVEVRTTWGSLLVLPLEDVSDGIVLAEVDGLDPVKATLVSSKFANLNGAQFQASSRETRNITAKLEIRPNLTTDSVAAVRRRIYSYFMPQSEVNLRFFDTEMPTVEIVGKVETCQAAIFSKDPEIDLSILCFDPDFTELTTDEFSGNTVSTTTETLVAYPGTVETGFIFALNLNRSLTDFTIYLRAPDDTVRTLDIAAASLVSGDVVTINTNPGNKAVTLTRSSVDSSLLYVMTPQSDWLKFYPGDNHIRVFASGAAIPYTVEYLTKYGGL